MARTVQEEVTKKVERIRRHKTLEELIARDTEDLKIAELHVAVAKERLLARGVAA